MRKLFICCAALLVFFAATELYPVHTAGSDHFTITNQSASLREISLRVVPLAENAEPLTVKTSIKRNNQLVAFGAKPVELLSIPKTGADLRIPLSRNLTAGHEYDIQIIIESQSGQILGNHNSLVKAQTPSGKDFFNRSFNPVRDEASQIRTMLSLNTSRNQ